MKRDDDAELKEETKRRLQNKQPQKPGDVEPEQDDVKEVQTPQTEEGLHVSDLEAESRKEDEKLDV